MGNDVLGNTGGGNVDFDGLLAADFPAASMLLLLMLLLLLLLLLMPVKFDPVDCLMAAGWGQPWPPFPVPGP